MSQRETGPQDHKLFMSHVALTLRENHGSWVVQYGERAVLASADGDGKRNEMEDSNRRRKI